MFEIVIVKPHFYLENEKVIASRVEELNKPNTLWWFAKPDVALKDVMQPTDEIEYGFPVSIMTCDVIWFEFAFCPNPDAEHFDVSTLYSECVHGGQLEEMLGEDVPRFAEIVNKRVKEFKNATYFYFDAYLNFYALYEIETSEFRDSDGGLDDILVYPKFIGELDFTKLAQVVINPAQAKE